MAQMHLITTIAITSLFLITLQWLTLQWVLRKDQADLDNVWVQLYQISWIAVSHEIPLFLVDGSLLQNVYNPDKSRNYCHISCQDQRITHLASISEHTNNRKLEKFTKALKEEQYTVIQINGLDPTLIHHNLKVKIPLHLLIFKDNLDSDNHHVVHISIFYERLSKYWWIARIDPSETHKKLLLRHEVRKDSFSMSEYSLVMEKFEIRNTIIDGINFGLPSQWRIFTKESDHLAFIECDKVRARDFKSRYPTKSEDEEYNEQFRLDVRNLLLKVKLILDDLGVNFWLSSGTCLGYYRQCDIIPYTQDVDIGIFIKDHRPEIIDRFFLNNLPLLHIFGKPEDSYELSFRDNHLKLDIFFFYEESNHFWNGGTDAKTGKKLKYVFPKFQLCWTEFLDILLKVPCDTLTYVEANYGSNWTIPIKNWDWMKSPNNVQENGLWPSDDWPKVIQLSPTSDIN